MPIPDGRMSVRWQMCVTGDAAGAVSEPHVGLAAGVGGRAEATVGLLEPPQGRGDPMAVQPRKVVAEDREAA